MLSRIAFFNHALVPRAATVLVARSTQTSAPLNTAAEGERDLVNFPRRKRPINSPKVRMGFLPDNWFTALYDKTGVTGPYMLGVGLTTFLCSKEIYVMEHEFYNGLTIGMLIIYAIKAYGPSVATYLDKEVDTIEDSWKAVKGTKIKQCENSIVSEKDAQWSAEGSIVLFDAKKENVEMQLEADYRQRLVDAHAAVKNKLDYQLEVSNVKTRVEQQHMVDWIVNSVRSSITPTQEAAALSKCFADLKTLAKA